MVSFGMSLGLKLKIEQRSARVASGAGDRRHQWHSKAFWQGNFVATTRV
jgi:anti-sigma-K factor RskA